MLTRQERFKRDIKRVSLYLINNCESIYADYSLAMSACVKKEELEDAKKKYIFRVLNKMDENGILGNYAKNDIYYSAVETAIMTGKSLKMGQSCA